MWIDKTLVESDQLIATLESLSLVWVPILLSIHADSDVTVQHEIQNTLALENGVYNLQLRELDNYTSHIDQVRLYAVDGEGERHSCPLTYAYHNELGRVTWNLRFDDDNRVDLKPRK